MKIYTKTGDKGNTGLYGGTRVSKNHIRIESYGTIDELNSWLGLLRDQDIETHFQSIIIDIQKNLFIIGSILATPEEKKAKVLSFPESSIVVLEQEIDTMNGSLPTMTHFILPGGHSTVSYCHIARTVCRRAERKVVELYEAEPYNEHVLPYLNRLSDYLFVLARKLSSVLNVQEIKWIH